MVNYAIITENEKSGWNDETGARYHFPIKYKSIITSGTKVIYYKSRKSDEDTKPRLSDNPHYFGYAIIGKIYVDNENSKNLYAEIGNYVEFAEGIEFKKTDNTYYEDVDNKNHWRNGVRKINQHIYNDIIKAANLDIDTKFEDHNINPQITYDSLIKHNSINNKNVISNYISRDIKRIGDLGEKIVWLHLKRTLVTEELSTLHWVANEGETPGYDIEYYDIKGRKVCIEVKTTTAKKFPYFHLTINELNASSQNELYFIYLVSDCYSNTPKIQILASPFNDDEFIFEAIAFKVYQKE